MNKEFVTGTYQGVFSVIDQKGNPKGTGIVTGPGLSWVRWVIDEQCKLLDGNTKFGVESREKPYLQTTTKTLVKYSLSTIMVCVFNEEWYIKTEFKTRSDLSVHQTQKSRTTHSVGVMRSRFFGSTWGSSGHVIFRWRSIRFWDGEYDRRVQGVTCEETSFFRRDSVVPPSLPPGPTSRHHLGREVGRWHDAPSVHVHVFPTTDGRTNGSSTFDGLLKSCKTPYLWRLFLVTVVTVKIASLCFILRLLFLFSGGWVGDSDMGFVEPFLYWGLRDTFLLQGLPGTMIVTKCNH